MSTLRLLILLGLCALSGRFAVLATKVCRRSDERFSPSNSFLYKALKEFLALCVVSHRRRALPERCAVGHKFAINLCRENGGMFRAFLGAKIPRMLFLAARLSDNRGHPFWQRGFFGQKQAAR
jgi:hypothetical protein